MTQTPSTIDKLKLKFPYQFNGENIGIHVSEGWIKIFTELCININDILGKDRMGFHWGQVKEKWGTARFYPDWENSHGILRLDIMRPTGLQSIALNPIDDVPFTPDQNAKREAVMTLIHEAEQATKTLCQNCGNTGKLCNISGLVQTLCPEHEAEEIKDSENDFGLGDIDD